MQAKGETALINPELWSPSTPNLNSDKISLFNSDNKLDEITIPFGIRTIEFSDKEGFKLNGIPMKLKGGCIHHDNGSKSKYII